MSNLGYTREDEKNQVIKINDYWKERGFDAQAVELRVYKIGGNDIFGIRSKMINGIPMVRLNDE